MAGTISLSLTQQLDQYGTPLAGGKLYFYQAGTVATPQNAFKDVALTLPHPNPITLDAAGRIPQFFLADGSIKVLLTDVNGTQQPSFPADGLLVIGPTGSGSGGSTVDPTTVLQTGWLQPIYGTGVVSGFVRCNARTIGSAASGATERANADTLALFTFLYNADANLAVSGGRGASAAADYAANKTIALPDFRSRAIAGLGDMGNSDNTLFSGVTFTSGNSTTLGSLLGASRRTLLKANLPPYTPAGTVATTLSQTFVLASGIGSIPTDGGSFAGAVPSASSTFTGTPVAGQTSTPFDINSPYGLVTIYLKM